MVLMSLYFVIFSLLRLTEFIILGRVERTLLLVYELVFLLNSSSPGFTQNSFFRSFKKSDSFFIVLVTRLKNRGEVG